MLSLKNVSMGYDEKALLKNVNIDFAENRIYALLGKSGSGKRTLLKGISNILPHMGEITLKDKPLNVKKQRLALVPQKNSLVKWQTVRQNILLPHKLRKEVAPQNLEELCAELGIAHLLDKYPGHLSGGEQQRAAIATALLFQPDILLLDEAFSALDAITKDEVHTAFLNAITKHKVTTVFVTHDIDEALYLAESIIILKNGNLLENMENPLFGITKQEKPLAYSKSHQEIKELI